MKKMTVLIVEDDPLLMRIYSDVFGLEGCAVIPASNGEEGLLLAYEKNPHLILLDIMMPKMNGLELLEKLKADPATKDIPVIMFTNLSGQNDAKTALAKGALQYVVKSEHEPQEVAKLVMKIIDKQQKGSK